MLSAGGGMDEVFEGLVREGMARMRWSRKKAEKAAHRYLKRRGEDKAKAGLSALAEQGVPAIRPARKVRLVKANAKPTVRPVLTPEEAAEREAAKAKRVLGKRLRKTAKKARAKQVGVAATGVQPAAKPKKKPLTRAQRVARALGPDDGRRRGGSPFLQGGSPGLGRRR
ncbi:hypothetical protein GCM10007164_20480 [Luteimonas padinae]|nr:hypothetical protein GCM10007164_20480 [Luteimonas padinae]